MPQPPYAVTQEQRELLQRRYGAARRRPVWLVLVVAGVAVLFVGWVVWAGAQQSETSIRWRTVGFADVTDRSVVVNFDVFKNRDEQVLCTLRALDVNGQLVGLAHVAVRRRGSDLYETSQLAVVRRPTAAEVQSCVALP